MLKLSEAPGLLITNLMREINADATFAGKFIRAVLDTFAEVSYVRPEVSHSLLQQFERVATTDEFVIEAMARLKKAQEEMVGRKFLKDDLPDEKREL
jgi:hypothetical protein